MNYINLRYISASSLGESLSNCKDLKELGEILEQHVNDDLHRAFGYIDKYDNQWDKQEVNLEQLKEEIQGINKIISLLKNS